MSGCLGEWLSEPAASASAAAGACCSPVVDCLSRCIVVNSINCSLLSTETRCRHAMTRCAQRRRRLVSQLAIRCPPLTVYGPASSAADHVHACMPTVWNHASTRPFNAVDVVSPSDAARLSEEQIALIAQETDTPAPDVLTNRLTVTATHYIQHELQLFASHLVPALYDVLAARQSLPPSSCTHAIAANSHGKPKAICRPIIRLFPLSFEPIDL